MILKDFLLNSGFNFQIVLLEENFVFAQNKKGYLAYDKIFVIIETVWKCFVSDDLKCHV